MSFAVGVSLEEDNFQGIFQGVSGDSEWFSEVGKLEDRF